MGDGDRVCEVISDMTVLLSFVDSVAMANGCSF